MLSKKKDNPKMNCTPNWRCSFLTEYTINDTLHAARKKTIDPAQFIQEPEEYIQYYNHQLIIVKLKGMSPVDYRVHAL